MKFSQLLVLGALLLSVPCTLAQTVANANVYPSNLEENMYFETYDATTRTINGLTFLVLSDGDNSQYVTPAFTVKLYLYDGEDPVFFRTFRENGIFHMGSKEYTNLSVPLGDIDIAPGTYRLGVYVNADKDFEENGDDNATLFKGEIVIE